MKKKIRLGSVVGAIIVVLYFSFTTIAGIKELNAKPTNSGVGITGSMTEYSVIYAKEVYEMKHLLLGFIPTYSDHYYLTLNNNGEVNRFLVKADTDWFSKNFEKEGLSKGTVNVKGLVKDVKDNSGINFNAVNAQMGDLGKISTAQFVDADYISVAIKKILSGLLLLTAALTIVIMLVLFKKDILKFGGIGVNIMVLAAVVQVVASLVLFFNFC